MEITVAVFSIAGAIALGAISPGPSFVLVARTAVAKSRYDGLVTAFGIGTGGFILALAALFGLHALLHSFPWFDSAMKVLGGLYLIVLGGVIWKGSREPLRMAASPDNPLAGTAMRSFWAGLGTQISNPKAAVIYASIFASLLPPKVPLFVNFLLPTIIFSIEAGWYSAVATALSASALRTTYLNSKIWIDRATGGMLALLGVKLLVTVWRA